MASGFIDRTGLDFDDRFIKGKGTQEFGLTAMSGVDVGALYLKGNSGVSTGYKEQKGTDIGYLLGDNAFTIRRTGRMSCGGQRQHGAAQNYGLAFLEENDFNSDKFTDCPARESIDMGGAYRTTYYVCFRIHSALDDPNLKITVNWHKIYEDHASIEWSGLKKVSNTEYVFVASAGGGDDGDDGASEVTMILEIPGVVRRECYVYFWNDTD